jgi:hypothetical protein
MCVQSTLKPVPKVLAEAISRLDAPVDPASTTPAALALRAFGGCARYLKRCLIDVALLSLALVSTYHPAEITSGSQTAESAGASGGCARSRPPPLGPPFLLISPPPASAP